MGGDDLLTFGTVRIILTKARYPGISPKTSLVLAIRSSILVARAPRGWAGQRRTPDPAGVTHPFFVASDNVLSMAR